MKSIKDLKITTREGLSVKNLQHFPSMEWGDDGGTQADIYYKGKYMGKMFQQGDGGMANFYSNHEIDNETFLDFKKACLHFLKRYDISYTSGEYEWLTNKTVESVNEDEYEAVVNCLEARYSDLKQATKYFNKGYLSMAIVKESFQTRYLASMRILDETFVANYFKLNKDYDIEILRANDKVNMGAY